MQNGHARKTPTSPEAAHRCSPFHASKTYSGCEHPACFFAALVCAGLHPSLSFAAGLLLRCPSSTLSGNHLLHRYTPVFFPRLSAVLYKIVWESICSGRRAALQPARNLHATSGADFLFELS